MSRPARPIEITETQHAEIRSLLRQRNLPAAHAQRLRAVVWAADGLGPLAIAKRTGASRESVMRWLARFREGGVAALADRPKAGRPRRYGGENRGENAAMGFQPPPGSNPGAVPGP